MLAVTRVFEDHPAEACWLILVAFLMDGLDGRIARLMHAESTFGINYDSLSDLIAFGVAPAALMFSVMSDEGSVKIASGVTTLYTICGALRLARFNVQRTREEKRAFTGLPIPAAASTAVAAYLVYHRFDPVSNLPAKLLPFLIAILSCLMVSKISYPTLKYVDIEHRKPFDYLVSIIVVLCIVLTLWPFLDCLLLAAFVGYVLYGLGRALYDILHPRRAGRAETKDETREPLPLER